MPVFLLFYVIRGWGLMPLGCYRLGVMAVLSSITDIAADGFMIERLAPNQRGWGNVIQVSGGYAGAAIGGGAFLILTEYYGWSNAGGVFWISSKFCHSSYRFCHLTRFIYSTFKQNSP